MSLSEIAAESMQALERLERTVKALRNVTGVLLEVGTSELLQGQTARLVDEANQMLQVIVCNGALLEQPDKTAKEYYVTLLVDGKELVLTKQAACEQDAIAAALAFGALTFNGKTIDLKQVRERVAL